MATTKKQAVTKKETKKATEKEAEAKTKKAIVKAVARKKVSKKAETSKKKEEVLGIELPDVKQLLEAGAHFGHAVSRWNPKMKPYIYGERNGVHIFDLFKTVEKLEEAARFLKKAASEGKRIVLVGTKGQAVAVVKEEGERVGVPYVVNRWIGGTLTNWEQISQRIKLLKEMREKMKKGGYGKYTKKERVVLRRKIERLERMYGGLVGLKERPEVVVVVDPVREKVVVREAKRLGVTVVALADTNADPEMIDYIVPANDDALKTVRLIVKSLVAAIEVGLKVRK